MSTYAAQRRTYVIRTKAGDVHTVVVDDDLVERHDAARRGSRRRLVRILEARPPTGLVHLDVLDLAAARLIA